LKIKNPELKKSGFIEKLGIATNPVSEVWSYFYFMNYYMTSPAS